MAPYFTEQDYRAVAESQSRDTSGNADLQRAYDKLLDLHNAVYPRIRNHNLDLHPRWQKTSIISRESAACLVQNPAMVLPYFRSREQAQIVERLMGCEPMAAGVDTFRHPVIELRLTPSHFAVELVVSPYAWWDQQNLVGKLGLAQHRAAFYQLLAEVGRDCYFGFWQGTDLDRMCLNSTELAHCRIVDAWMETFCDGQDWFRIGKWFDPTSPALDEDTVAAEVFNAVRVLNRLYSFLVWTSNNNFQSFYDRNRRAVSRLYA